MAERWDERRGETEQRYRYIIKVKKMNVPVFFPCPRRRKLRGSKRKRDLLLWLCIRLHLYSWMNWLFIAQQLSGQLDCKKVSLTWLLGYAKLLELKFFSGLCDLFWWVNGTEQLARIRFSVNCQKEWKELKWLIWQGVHTV